MNLESRNKNQVGYLLIEVLITIAILGTVIVFIVQALSSSLFAVRRAAYYTKALMITEQLIWDIRLEALGGSLIPADSFPRSSEFSDENRGFKWRQELLQTDIPNLSEMILTLTWRDSKASGQFSVSTLLPTTEALEE